MEIHFSLAYHYPHSSIYSTISLLINPLPYIYKQEAMTIPRIQQPFQTCAKQKKILIFYPYCWKKELNHLIMADIGKLLATTIVMTIRERVKLSHIKWFPKVFCDGVYRFVPKSFHSNLSGVEKSKIGIHNNNYFYK